MEVREKKEIQKLVNRLEQFMSQDEELEAKSGSSECRAYFRGRSQAFDYCMYALSSIVS